MKTPIHASLLLIIVFLSSISTDAQIRLKSNYDFGSQSLISLNSLKKIVSDSSYMKSTDTTLMVKEDSSMISKEKELNTILINTTKKTVDLHTDRIIYHVTNDQDAAYSYIYDIMKKVPGIFTDQEDQLVVNGSQNFLLLINGRKSSLMSGNLRDILQSFPASNVLDIEVFSNPPPRYASEGVSAVINLILKKKNITGYNGSLSYQMGSPYSSNGNLSLIVKTGIVSYSTQNGLSQRRNPVSTSDYIMNNYLNNEKIVKIGTGQSSSNSKYTNHELVFEIDSLNLLSVNFSTGSDGGNNTFLNKSNNFIIDGPILNSFNTQTNGMHKNYNGQWGFDFETNLGKRKKNLFSISYQDIQTTDSSTNNFNVIPEINATKSINNTNNTGLFSERTFQLNYNNPLGSNSIDLGSKVITRINESNYYYKSLDFLTNSYIIDPFTTDEFSYTQNIYAVYGNYDFRMKKNMIVVGTSVENVEIFGNYKTNGENIYRKFLNFIPSISLARRINNFNIRLGYAQKIERPSLYYLNPYVDRTDPYFISYGNPNLDPSLTHSFTASIGVFKSKYSLNLYLLHNITNNAILSYTTIGSNQISQTTYGNIGYKRNTMANFSGNLNVNKDLRISLNWSPSYIQFTSYINENKVMRSGLIQNLSGNFTLKMPMSWRLSGNLNYFSNSVTVQGKASDFLTTGLNLNRDFGKKKQLGLTLSIINPHQANRKYITENFDRNFYFQDETISVIRQYTARLSYRFGGFEGHVAKKKKGINNTDLKTAE